ncbi:MAG TPA: hypothetical protein VH257_12135, partial [Chloroflexota bacterium]|nr:hypothetical protein [Chloroflexota bacterium]
MSDADRPPSSPDAESMATEVENVAPVDAPEEAEGREEVDERLRVLRLVARGAISPQEAAELLAALDPPAPPPGPPSWVG